MKKTIIAMLLCAVCSTAAFAQQPDQQAIPECSTYDGNGKLRGYMPECLLAAAWKIEELEASRH